MQVSSSYSSALRSYQQSSNKISNDMTQVSSGKKINSAADNPAYLVILQNMEGQSRGYEQAIRNAQDTTSMLYTAEGAAGDSSAVLQDMRALSVQAGDGTLTDQDRSYIQAQMTQLGSQLTANANGANFNGMATNNGSLAGFQAQIGADSGQTMSVALPDLTANALGVGGVDVSTQTSAQSAIASLDAATQQLSSSRSGFGAQTNALEYTVSVLTQADENTQAAASQIGDTDMAKAMMDLRNEQVKQYASIYAMKQNMTQQKSSISLLA